MQVIIKYTSKKQQTIKLPELENAFVCFMSLYIT